MVTHARKVGKFKHLASLSMSVLHFSHSLELHFNTACLFSKLHLCKGHPSEGEISIFCFGALEPWPDHQLGTDFSRQSNLEEQFTWGCCAVRIHCPQNSQEHFHSWSWLLGWVSACCSWASTECISPGAMPAILVLSCGPLTFFSGKIAVFPKNVAGTCQVMKVYVGPVAVICHYQ